MMKNIFLKVLLCALLLGQLTTSNAESTDAKATDASAKYGPKHGKVYEGKELTKLPKCRFQAKPVYPSKLRAAGITGQAKMDFVVTEDGSVADVRSVDSANLEFVRAAADSLYRWKFHAGEIDGKPVSTHLIVTIAFALDTAPTPKPNKPPEQHQ